MFVIVIFFILELEVEELNDININIKQQKHFNFIYVSHFIIDLRLDLILCL